MNNWRYLEIYPMYYCPRSATYHPLVQILHRGAGTDTGVYTNSIGETNVNWRDVDESPIKCLKGLRNILITQRKLQTTWRYTYRASRCVSRWPARDTMVRGSRESTRRTRESKQSAERAKSPVTKRRRSPMNRARTHDGRDTTTNNVL